MAGLKQAERVEAPMRRRGAWAVALVVLLGLPSVALGEAGPFAAGRGAHRTAGALPEGLVVAPEATERFLVQFEGPILAPWKEGLERVAARIYDYHPDHAFLVRLDPQAREEASTLAGVRAVTPYHPGLKLSPLLPREGPVEVTVLIYPDEPMDDALHLLEATGARVLAWAQTAREGVVDARVDAGRLPHLARLEAVSWIEPALDEAGLDNAAASPTMQSGGAGGHPIHDAGFNGSTQLVAVCDTGLGARTLGLADPYVPPVLVEPVHETFEDDGRRIEYNRHLSPFPLPLPPHRKVALYYSPQENGNRGDASDAQGHGTHVTATLAGDAAPHGSANGNDGLAFAARLVVCDISTGGRVHVLNDYDRYWAPAHDAGARVVSNSWGTTPTNAYTLKARQHDAYAWDHRDFVIVRSVGNAIPDGAARPEALAKSVLAAGGTANDGEAQRLGGFATVLAPEDGRIKPDVVAPGECIVSAMLPGPSDYACLSGTSHSTPLVAAAAVLVRDAFAKQGLPEPSSALVRALLLASGQEIADDLGQPGFPNHAQGWGRIQLDHVLPPPFVRDEDAGLATGQEESIAFDVRDGAPLLVLLAWTDHPAAAGANPALVNDLDLVVTSPSGQTHLGNAGQSTPDRRNVAEAVRIAAPEAGTWTITVRGANVPMGPQPYALVALGKVDATQPPPE